MKIAVLEPLGISAAEMEAYAEDFRRNGHTVTLYPDRTADKAELMRRTGDNDIIVIANTPYPEEGVREAKNLKLIDVAFTGVDHVPLSVCREAGVTVCNAAGYSTPAVAELAVGLTVACLRKLSEGETAARNGGTSAGLIGTEIAGKTVGILGTGTIGLYAARLFSAFGAKIIAASRTERAEAKAMGIEYVPMQTLFSTADIVSVHVPSNAATRRLVSRELIDSMKPTAVLINTARGAVVDNEALAKALTEGRLGAAGIDVFDREPPLSPAEPLLNCPRLIPAPHVGFLTKESMQRRAKIVFETVQAFIDGTPKNVCR